MNKMKFQSIVFIVFALISNKIFPNNKNDTIKLFENNKIVIMNYGDGDIIVKFNSSSNITNYQIRKFYDRPIYLGVMSETSVAKLGLEKVINNYQKNAMIYQEEHYINDLKVENSQLKIIYKLKGKKVKFYYLKANHVQTCENGIFSNFWCDEEHKKYSFIEVNINGQEIYFNKIKN